MWLLKVPVKFLPAQAPPTGRELLAEREGDAHERCVTTGQNWSCPESGARGHVGLGSNTVGQAGPGEGPPVRAGG